MNTPRRRFGTDQKATILKRYLVDKVPASDLCDEYGIKPNQIYTWQKILFDHAETAFQQAGGHAASKVSAQEEKIVRLENKLQQKNEVIAELMEENVRAKKATGEL
jgi:transposase